MSQTNVNTYLLTDDESVDFARNYYCPTQETINQYEEHINTINNSIDVINVSKGFEIEAQGLDLSFLDKTITEKNHSTKAKIVIENMDMVFIDENQNIKEISVDCRSVEEYIEVDNDILWKIAA